MVLNGAGSFGQDYGEGDEGKGLPKLRNFKPDEQSDGAAAGRSEEAANGALLGVSSQGCQFVVEIARATENGKSEQPHSNVSVLRGFEMQVDDDTAIDGEHAEEGVLHLKVRRFESTAKSRDGGRGGECTKIRMDGQQGTVGRDIK